MIYELIGGPGDGQTVDHTHVIEEGHRLLVPWPRRDGLWSAIYRMRDDRLEYEGAERVELPPDDEDANDDLWHVPD